MNFWCQSMIGVKEMIEYSFRIFLVIQRLCSQWTSYREHTDVSTSGNKRRMSIASSCTLEIKAKNWICGNQDSNKLIVTGQSNNGRVNCSPLFCHKLKSLLLAMWSWKNFRKFPHKIILTYQDFVKPKLSSSYSSSKKPFIDLVIDRELHWLSLQKLLRVYYVLGILWHIVCVIPQWLCRDVTRLLRANRFN